MAQQPKTPQQNGATLLESMILIKKAMESLLNSGLNKKAIIVLVRDRTHLPKTDIEKVMDTLCGLEKWYTIHK
jgi:hypothetical protein